jgi:uncharacterized RDD family membrane protein YckC
VISGTSAGFGRRFAALLYDGLLLAAVLMVYTLVVVLIHGGAVTEESGRVRWWAFRTGALLMIGAYYVLNWTRSGQTLGMRAWRLRTVTDTGKPLQPARAVVRFVWALIAWAPAGLGVLWLYVDPEHLALHDRLSRTRMVLLSRS